jgi:hypothetical protein
MEQRGIPLHFVQLAPEIVREALAGQDDVLAGENTKAEALYRQHTKCQNGCGETMEKSFSTVAFAFSDPNWHIPRCVMKCYACQFTLNPFDGMVVNKGDSNKAKYGDVPLINPNDG